MALVPTHTNRPPGGSRRVGGPAVTDPAEPPRDERRRAALTPRALWRQFKRLTQLGFPPHFPIIQFPNAPLIVAFLAGEVAHHSHGSGHAYASSVSYLAMIVWAYEELVWGVNWFRRLLGLAFVILTAVHVGMALGG